jgi:hypothetical protein
MSAEIPGLRPAVLESATVSELALLLAFRHFFRHAYAVTFDAARLTRELNRLFAVEPVVSAALDAFSHFLRAAMLTVSS